MATDEEKDELKKKLDSLKPKKKKMAVPEGFLEEAKNYEGKLMAIRVISEREKDRVILMFKKMIAQGKEDAIRIEREQELAKREAEAKAAAEKKRQQELAKKQKSLSLFGKKK